MDAVRPSLVGRSLSRPFGPDYVPDGRLCTPPLEGSCRLRKKWLQSSYTVIRGGFVAVSRSVGRSHSWLLAGFCDRSLTWDKTFGQSCGRGWRSPVRDVGSRSGRGQGRAGGRVGFKRAGRCPSAIAGFEPCRPLSVRVLDEHTRICLCWIETTASICFDS